MTKRVLISAGAILVAAGSALLGPSAYAVSVTNGLVLDLEANNSTVTVDGSNRVTNVDDLSSQNNDAVQATEANRPLLVTGANGLKSFQFDGVNDYLQVADAASLQLGTGDFTVVVAYKVDNALRPNNQQNTLVSKSFNNFEFFEYNNPDGTPRQRTYLGGAANQLTGTTPIASNTLYVGTLKRTGTTLTSYLNGTQDATSTNSTNGSNVSGAGTNLFLGSRNSLDATLFLDGDIYGVAIYNRALTDPERLTVESELVPEPTSAALLGLGGLLALRRRAGRSA